MSTQAEIPAVEANASIVEPDDQKQLVAIVHQNNLHADTALSLQSTFAPLFKQARDVIAKSRGIVVTDANQKLEIKMARACRLELKAIRVAGDKTRKETKEESLRRGKAIDGFYAILAHTIETEEQRLEAQEQFAERQEAARKAALKADREKVLIGIQVDSNLYSLGDMTEETFQQLVEGTKLARAAEQERKRKEEAERIEREAKEQAERERVLAENDRLKKEASEREAKARLERELADKELKRLSDEKRANELKAQQEREAAEKERKRIEAENAAKLAEQKRIADEAAAKERARVAEEKRIADEKAKAEREESDRKLDEMKKAVEKQAAKEKAARDELEAKVRAQREADELRAKQEAEAARKAAAAPDKDRLITYANAIRALEIPTFNTPEAKAIATTIAASRDRFVEWCEQKAFAL